MKGKRILVVDDDSELREVLKILLTAKDYEVQMAEDGNEAMEAVKKKNPDLIVLDGMMPGIHGFEVAYRLKNSPDYEYIPVIMLTGVVKELGKSEQYWREYSRADEFLSKPFDYQKLLEIIDRLIRENDRERGDGRARFRI